MFVAHTGQYILVNGVADFRCCQYLLSIDGSCVTQTKQEGGLSRVWGTHTCLFDTAHVVDSVDTAVAAATLITGRFSKFSLKGKSLLFASHPNQENPRACINSSCQKK